MFYTLNTESLVRVGVEEDVGVGVDAPVLSVREVDGGGQEQFPTMDADAIAIIEQFGRKAA